MNQNILKKIDWSILISSVILLLIGMIALFSATKNANNDEFYKQIIWVCVSLAVMVITVVVDYKTIARFSWVLYGIIIASLVAVLFTTPVNGATRWFNIGGIFTFQPSEFAKIIFVVFFAYVIVQLQKKDKSEINKFWKLLVCLVVTAVPMVLIMIQPDTGTAVPFVILFIVMLFVAVIKKKYIFISLLIIIIALPLMYMFVLPEHAKSRIDIYLDPYKDPRGAGYNIIQSKLAIGSGEMFGMGLLKGNQTQLGYLYPKTTDFIYAVIGEEMGFVVAVSIIILYVFLILRAIKVAKNARDDLGSYIAIGIAGLFIFHVVQNIGMTMGLLPITGVPLLFISYGGSSLITSFILIGLLLNISARRN